MTGEERLQGRAKSGPMERKGHKNSANLMRARKFLVLRAIPATSAKSTLILYLGYLRDENLSPNEKNS
jgi:hypothetical protein